MEGLTSSRSWLDPTPGSLLPVVAGGRIEVRLTCANPEQKVVSFRAEVTGLGAWTQPVKPLPVVPFESGVLAVEIAAAADAQEGSYPFSIQLFCNGDPIEPNGTISLVLQVTARAEPEPVTVTPEPEAPLPKESAPPPSTTGRKPKAEPISAVGEAVPPETVETAGGAPPDQIAPPEEPETPIDVTPPEPAPVTRQIEQPAPEPEPEPEPEPVQVAASTPEPEPEPISSPIPEPIPTPAPKPEPRVVTFAPEPAPEPEVEEPDPTLIFASDQVVANPAEGTTLYVRPGETLLVRFNINNDQSGVRTYVLQEDRSLQSEWIVLVRDQVNITPGGSGDLAFALKPPLHAEPANYPFTVSYGVLGKPLVPCYLTLAVQATPATKLTAKRTSVTIGPTGRSVPFDLTVETAGNSDSAYRIAVVEERADESGETGTVEVYETPTWLYLFDREFENLVSPASGRTPPPVGHRLMAERKGIWWLGWKESHRFKVVAAPVTDPANGGKTENSTELVAGRWRIFPMPWFIMLPLLCLVFVLLGSGATDFHVTNALQGDDGAYYVVGTEPDQPKLDVHLAWSAPFYAVLKLEKVDQGRFSALPKSGDKATDAAEVIEYGQAQRVSYELGSKFYGAGEKADVRLVPLRSQNMLQISVAGAPNAGVQGKDVLGDERVPVTTRDLTVMIPQSGLASINFTNLTGRGKVNGQQIVMWTVRYPTGFKIMSFLTSQGDNQVVNPATSVTAKIAADLTTLPSEGEATWEMLTTDGSYQLLRIKLKVAGQ